MQSVRDPRPGDLYMKTYSRDENLVDMHLVIDVKNGYIYFMVWGNDGHTFFHYDESEYFFGRSITLIGSVEHVQ